ncbi:MAG: ATPase [Sporomusaceae bacterium]|nr:ATPase [Sporomusaceae bacterium]
MSVYKILDDLETLLQASTHIPFSNRLVVEEDELCQLIDALREALPTELMEANRILSERSRIMDDVQKEAQTIVAEAQTYVGKLTEENSITQQAQEQSNQIIEEARERAKVYEEQALAYAQEVFSYLEANLEKVTEAVREGRERMRQK